MSIKAQELATSPRRRPTPAAAADAALQEARAELNVRLNAIIGTVTGRGEVLATMVWDQPKNAHPAWFDPQRVLITINGDQVLPSGTHPADVDPTTREGRLEQPVLVGVVCHEAGHARSNWDHGALRQRAGSPLIATVADNLLEPWVEALQLQHRASDQRWLRAAANEILRLSPLEDQLTRDQETMRAATAALLVLGRVDAGVLSSDDTQQVEATVRSVLGDQTLAQLRSLSRRALQIPENDLDAIIDVARRIIDVLELDDADNEQIMAVLPVASCHAGSRPGDQDDAAARHGDHDSPAQRPASGLDALAASVSSLAATVASAAAADVAAELVQHRAATDPDEQVLAAKAEEAKERAAARKAAEVFTADAGTSADEGGPVAGHRPPTASERAAANALAVLLRQARYRAKHVTVVTSQFPPGRLSARAVVLGAAQEALGLPITAEPFKRKRRTHTDEPTIQVGIAPDVSASMQMTAAAMASAAWVIGQAVQQVQGRSAVAAWGSKVTPVTWPGRPPQQVPILSTPEGTEVLPEAIRALDGTLGLSSGRSARLLVIASDGVMDAEQRSITTGLIDRLNRCGCPVLWLCLDRQAQVVSGAVEVAVHDTASAARVIGRAAIDALSHAGA
jgi:hypothetical protein